MVELLQDFVFFRMVAQSSSQKSIDFTLVCRRILCAERTRVNFGFAPMLFRIIFFVINFPSEAPRDLRRSFSVGVASMILVDSIFYDF